jgi:hypothetical protein
MFDPIVLLGAIVAAWIMGRVWWLVSTGRARCGLGGV